MGKVLREWTEVLRLRLKVLHLSKYLTLPIDFLLPPLFEEVYFTITFHQFDGLKKIRPLWGGFFVARFHIAGIPKSKCQRCSI